MYKKEILSNGLKIICQRMSEKQSVALGIWIKVGGRYESIQLKGISHFLEHLLFKGTKKYSCRKLKESIEGVGGSLNGFTAEELTCYYVKIPSRYLEVALDILSDMVIQPSLPAQEMEKERTVIIEEIKMYKDLPQSYVHELLDELLWPGQPLGASITGTVDSVGRIKRDDLDQFRKRYYAPANIVVSAAGKLDFIRLRNKIKQAFSPIKYNGHSAYPAAKLSQRKPQLKLLAKDTEQTHLALGVHGFKREHPLRHAATLLNIVLGANMSSRLFNELREKRGLAYEIATHVKRFQDCGAFLVHAGVDNSKVIAAVVLILKELEKVKRQLVTSGEFKRAREFYLGQLTLALEDTLDHMLWIGESTAAIDKVYSLSEIIKEVEKVKPEDIRAAARALFKEENLNLALIGPLKESESQIYKHLSIS